MIAVVNDWGHHMVRGEFADAASRIRVGIFWRVGDWDDRRSVPYSLLPKLADISGVDLYMVARDHECAAGTIPVTALPYPDDIYGTAWIMRSSIAWRLRRERAHQLRERSTSSIT